MISTNSHPKTNELYLDTDIIALIDSVCSKEMTFEELDVNIRNLEEQVFNMDSFDEDLVSDLYDGITLEKKQILNDRYCEWETIHENMFAEAILQDQALSAKEYTLYNRFCSLISKEVGLIKDFNYDHLLFIGSGPFPITAILLHEMTGKTVNCLEREEGAAVISRQVLKKLGLENKIIVHVGEGGDYDLSEYQVILNALLAKPKWCIMKNIKEKCNDSTRVLCRTSYGLRRLLYESTSDNAIHGYNVKGRQFAGYDETISTLLLVNKNETVSGISLEWISSLRNGQKKDLVGMMNRIIQHDNHNGFLKTMKETDIYFDILQRDLVYGLKHLLVVKNENRLLGQLLLNLSYVDTYKHRADVSTLMIDESIRGRDISLKVVMALLDKCDELNIKYITLDVRAGSKVSLLWKYLGFEPYGELECYSKVNEDQYKGIFMYKDVETLRNTLVRKFENLYSNTTFAD